MATTAQEAEPTEDEYYEQELLDFLQIIESVHTSLTTQQAVGPEPSEEIQCIVTRFDKLDSPMPPDQWIRVYSGLKRLSQIIKQFPSQFNAWKASLTTLFKSAKKFKSRYPSAQSGEAARAQKQDDQMNQVLEFAQEFADDADIKMKDKSVLNAVPTAPPLQSLSNNRAPNSSGISSSGRAAPRSNLNRSAMKPKSKKSKKSSKAQVRPRDVHPVSSPSLSVSVHCV